MSRDFVLCNKRVVATGKLQNYTRKELLATLGKHGALPMLHVSKKEEGAHNSKLRIFVGRGKVYERVFIYKINQREEVNGMKIIQTHPKNYSAEERRQQLLCIHSRCVASIRDTKVPNLKKTPRIVEQEH